MRGCGRAKKLAHVGLNQNAVVADQHDRQRRRRARDQRQGQPALAGAGRGPRDQQGPAADRHGGSRGSRPDWSIESRQRASQAAGSQTVNRAGRAPRRRPRPPWPDASGSLRRSCRRAPRRSGERSTIRARNSARTRGLAGRCRKRSKMRSNASAGDARPVVVDHDLVAALRWGSRRPFRGRMSTRTLLPGSEKERALSMRLLNTCPRRES